MSDEEFAALVAAIIATERRIGNTYPSTEIFDREYKKAIEAGKKNEEAHKLAMFEAVNYQNQLQSFEDLAVQMGIPVSGRYLKKAFESQDLAKLTQYYTLNEITLDDLATVGVGNVWIKTAQNLLDGKACNAFDECMHINFKTPLTITKYGIFGIKFETKIVDNGWKGIGQSLLNEDVNIEYISANLEAGMERAKAMGIPPTAWLAALWHTGGVISPEEIEREKNDPNLFHKDPSGNASEIVKYIPEIENLWIEK